MLKFYIFLPFCNVNIAKTTPNILVYIRRARILGVVGMLSEIVGPLGVAHVAGLEEFLVHGESARERVRRVSDLGHLEVLVE